MHDLVATTYSNFDQIRLVPNALVACIRAVGKGGGARVLSPRICWIRNPISIGGEADYAYQIPPGYSNLPTALYNVQFLIN